MTITFTPDHLPLVDHSEVWQAIMALPPEDQVDFIYTTRDTWPRDDQYRLHTDPVFVAWVLTHLPLVDKWYANKFGVAPV